MSKHFYSRLSILVTILLVLQLVLPVASVSADAGTMLPPSNLALQLLTPDDVKLTWSPVNGATGYNVYGIIDGQLIMLGTVTSTSYTHSNLAEGSYSYVVSTLSTGGESGPCAPVSVDIVYPEMAAPATLTEAIQNGNDIVLSWGASQYAETYKVYQIGADGQSTLVTSTAAKTYTVANAAAGTYTYAVSAANSLYGESPLSTSVQATVAFPTMAAPANLTFSIANGNDVTLRWNSAANATGYKIYQITDGQKELKSTVTTTTATLTNVPAGDYTYEIHSFSSRFGESAEGSQISVTVGAVTMTAPGNFAYKLQNVNDIVLSWSTTPYANSYNVYQIIDEQKVLKSNVAAATVTYTNMAAGDYTYEVHSVSTRFGESAEGSQVSLTVDAVTMAAPANFTYSLQNINDIVLSWASTPNANSYKVYQVVNGQKTLKSTATGTTVTYTNTAAGNYTYEVHSVSTRFGESAEGSQVSLTVVFPTMAAPGNFAYTVKNGNDIALTWTAAANADSYKVYQVINGQKALKSTVTGTAVTYAAVAAGSYTYEIHSYSSRFGESAEGSQVSLTVVYPTMQAPTNAASSIKGATSFALSWDTVPYATNYKVYQIVNGQKSLKSNIAAATVTYTNMPSGDYLFEIHSYSDRFGESAEGSQVTVSLKGQMMFPPTNLTYSIANGNDITIKWTAAADATSYKIYQVIGGQETLQKTVTTASGTLTNMPAGDYTFAVHSVSTLYGESPEGVQIAVSLVHPVMAAPTNLAYKIQNGNDIVLTWGAAQYAVSYKVYQVTDGQKVLKATATSATTTFTNMPAGDYAYEVHSYSDRFGESAEGTQVSLSLVQPVMQAPGNFTYSVANGNDIILKWDSAAYATNYKVYQIINGQKVLKNTIIGDITARFNNMLAGDYVYEIHSVSPRFGESPEGSQVSFKLVWPVMQAPANFKQTISNGNDIVLSWNDSTYATSYKIYQIINDQKVLKSTVEYSTVKTFSNMPEGDYVYEVHSVSPRFGESPEGSQVSFKLVWPVMQAPANFKQTIANGNDIALRWDAAAFANSYKVYQIINGQKVLKSTVTDTTAVTYTNMPQGDYVYEIHSLSPRFGESVSGSTASFTLVWPVVQPPVMTDSVFNINNATLSWKAVTWANEYRVYEVTSGIRQLLYKGTALSYTIYNMTQGTHSYEMTAYSTRFGESEASNRLTETIVYPVMQTPTATIKLLDTKSARISWGFVTYANVYNIYEMIGGSPVLVAKNINNLSYTLTNLTYANHEYYVTAYSNSFGESQPSNTVLAKLIVDTEAPKTTATAPADWTNQSADVTLSATDNETGVAKTFYSINDSAFVEGTSFTISQEGINKVSFYSVDKVGNIENTQTIEVKIDKTVPATTADNIPAGWSKSDVAVNLTARDALSGIGKTFYAVNGSEYVEGNTFTVSQEGTNQVSFYSVDKAGNIEKDQTIEIKIDKEAPATTAEIPTDWSKENVTVNFTTADTMSGAYKVFYAINGSEYVEGSTITIGNEGINQISFYSIDKAGNIEKAQTAEVKIDRTAPATTAKAPASWSKEDVTINLTAADAASGVAKTVYAINGSEYIEGNTFTVDKEGINTISFYSVDKVGNIENAQTIEVKIDKTMPKTTADTLANWSKETVTVNLSATDTTSGIEKTFYSINGSEYTEGNTFTVEKEGINQVAFYSIDKAGNIEEAQTVEVKIDKTAPITTSVVSTNWSKEDVALTLIAEDTLSGIGKTFYSINGSEYTEGTTLTVDKEGINKVSFYSVDKAGNIEETQTIEVKIDKTAPMTTSAAPTNWLKGTAAINLTAADALSGVEKTFYSINGAEYIEGTTLTVDKEGINKVSFYSVDKAGNIEEVQTIEVKIDKTAPVIELNINDEYSLGSLLRLDYTKLDSQSGIVSEKVVVTDPNGNNKNTLFGGNAFWLYMPGTYTATITATDAAGNTTIVKKQFVVYIPACVEVTPNVIKGSKGVFTVRVDLPSGVSQGFDLNTVTLNGVKALSDNNGYYNQAKNGQFKFERSQFAWNSSEVNLEFRGYVNGYLVIGHTTVKVQK